MLRRMIMGLFFMVMVCVFFALFGAEITGAAEIKECKAYITGIGKAVDFKKALQCFESKKEPVNRGYVAYMYFTGKGVKEDNAKFKEIFNPVKAKIEADCNKGSGDACFLMGIYADAKQDYQLAMKWYLKAADKAEMFALKNIGNLYAEGQGVEQDYQKAMEFYIKAAHKGELFAMRLIGELYGKGNGVKQDYQKAMEWYLKAAGKGEAGAMFYIGLLYDNGHGVKKDYDKALLWYLKAAEKDLAVAMINIGTLYSGRQGVKQDYQKAMEWYLKAADKGEAIAMTNVGTLYGEGHGVKQDYQNAMKWYLKAADKGDVTAMKNIAFLYKNGLGVMTDSAMADEWYAKAGAVLNQKGPELVKEADRWIEHNCDGNIYPLIQLLTQNPYDIGGKCFLLHAYSAIDIQLLSRTVALFTYPLMERNYIVYTDFGDESAPVGKLRTFVVKGDSQPYKYTSVIGSVVTASKVHVLREAFTESGL